MPRDVSVPWYTPGLYTVITSSRDNQCIAPSKPTGTQPKRCKSWITREELASVTALQDQICNSRDEYEIVRKTRKLVATRCCTFAGHREKLEDHAECHRLVAELFIDEFTTARLLKVKVPRDLLLVNINNDNANKLIPYEQDPEESFIRVLKSGIIVDDKSPYLGLVYAFTTPSYPGVVKVGFTGSSWKYRRSWLEKCMPNAQLVASIEVCHPERMERLIHIELQPYRRRIIRCKSCNCGHIEFFETSTAKVKTIFDDWDALLAKEELYIANCLSGAWAERVDRTAGLGSVAMLRLAAEQEQNKKLHTQEEQMDSLWLRIEKLQIEIGQAALKANHSLNSAASSQVVESLTPQYQSSGQSRYTSSAARTADTPYDIGTKLKQPTSRSDYR